MNFKRIFTAIISLVLVCCLLVSVSPIKAEAVPLDPIFLGWTLSEAVYYAVALGVGIGVGCNVFEAAAEGADLIEKWVKTNLDEGEIAELYNEDGLIKILATNDPDLPYMVSADLIEAVRNWAFENDVITETSVTVPYGYWLYNGNQYKPLPDYDVSLYPYACIYNNSLVNRSFLVVSSLPLGFSSRDSGLNTNLINPHDESVTYLEYSYYSGDWGTPTSGTYSANQAIISYSWRCSWKWANYDVQQSDGSLCILTASEPIKESSTSVSVADGYDQYYIAPSSSSLADGYELWHQKAYEYTNEDGSIDLYYPIALGESLEDTMSFSQEDVWSGAIAGGAVVDPNNPPSTNPDIDIGDDSSNLANILSILSTISNYQQTGNIQTQTKIEGLADTLGVTNGILSDSKGLLESILASNAFGFESVVNSVISLPGSIGGELEDIENSIGTLGGLIGGIGIDTDTMKDTLAGVLAGVTAIPAELADVIAGTIAAVFVPSEGYIDSKVEALTAKFPIAESIQATGKDLKGFFMELGQKPPIIYIDLGAQRGFHDIGGRTVFIDLTWYAEYKPTMDAILSAFLWLWFAWRMYLSAPGILQGAAGAWHRYESAAGKDSASFLSVLERDVKVTFEDVKRKGW